MLCECRLSAAWWGMSCRRHRRGRLWQRSSSYQHVAQQLLSARLRVVPPPTAIPVSKSWPPVVQQLLRQPRFRPSASDVGRCWPFVCHVWLSLVAGLRHAIEATHPLVHALSHQSSPGEARGTASAGYILMENADGSRSGTGTYNRQAVAPCGIAHGGGSSGKFCWTSSPSCLLYPPPPPAPRSSYPSLSRSPPLPSPSPCTF